MLRIKFHTKNFEKFWKKSVKFVEKFAEYFKKMLEESKKLKKEVMTFDDFQEISKKLARNIA